MNRLAICLAALTVWWSSLTVAGEDKAPAPLDYKGRKVRRGAAWRGNLCRTGVHQTAGVPKLTGVKWTFNAGSPVRSSPVIFDGVVYVGSEGAGFHAIDAATGKARWHLAVKGGVTSSACVADGVVTFGGNDGKLYAVAAGTGKVRWAATGRGRITTSPAVAYGIVFVEGCWGFASVASGRLRKSRASRCGCGPGIWRGRAPRLRCPPAGWSWWCSSRSSR